MQQSNPAVYFEIPVSDMNRAMAFYREVLGFTFKESRIDGYHMALFPFQTELPGISGALAMGEVYRPSKEGVILYLGTSDIKAVMRLALERGGQELYPVTDNGLGLVAEFEDSEGNRIGLYQSLSRET
jgi:predicted enzyme related to lactoylglutathione lyase